MLGFGGTAAAFANAFNAATGIRVRELPMTLVREWLGRSLGRNGSASGAFQIVSGTELRIDTRGPRAIEVALDGEVVKLDLPLHYRSRPRALSVFVPRR